MTKLYKASVSDHQFHADGIGYFMQQGEPDTVRGEPMVKLTHGVLVPAKGWHADRRAALLEAAQRVVDLGHRLLAQADKMRDEADKEATVSA
jgi:hypothetical protein